MTDDIHAGLKIFMANNDKEAAAQGYLSPPEAKAEVERLRTLLRQVIACCDAMPPFTNPLPLALRKEILAKLA